MTTPQDKTAALEALDRLYHSLPVGHRPTYETIRAALLHTGWQTIDSAPRDGSAFMHWRKEHNDRGICHYHAGDDLFLWTGGIVAKFEDGDMWCTSTVLAPPTPQT